MATLAVHVATRTGVEFVTVTAAGGGDQFLNTGREIVYIWTDDVTPITVTFAPAGVAKGLAYATYTVVLEATGEKLIGPFDPSAFNSASGMVAMTYSGVTNMWVGVMRIT